MRTCLLRAALLASLLPGAGCSLLLVHGPPPEPIVPTPQVDCTRSRAGPSVDVVLGVAAAGIGLLAAEEASQPCTGYGCIAHGGNVEAAGLGIAAVGVGFLVSSAVGFSKTSRCADVQQWQLACAGGDRRACEALVHRPEPQVTPQPPARP